MVVLLPKNCGANCVEHESTCSLVEKGGNFLFVFISQFKSNRNLRSLPCITLRILTAQNFTGN